MSEKHSYRVGDKVHHVEFGEGLVVEIRDRPFYDILEVVFSSGVKRLSSIHPQLRPKPPEEPAAATPRRRRRVKISPGPENGSRLPYLKLDPGVWTLLQRMSDQDVEPTEDYRILLDAEELKGQGDFDHLIGLDHHGRKHRHKRIAHRTG